jgi:hypothetical protein
MDKTSIMWYTLHMKRNRKFLFSNDDFPELFLDMRNCAHLLQLELTKSQQVRHLISLQKG